MALWTDRDLAEHLGVAVTFVQDQCRRANWPHARVGRAYRFTDEQVLEIVKLVSVPVRRDLEIDRTWGRRRRGH